MFLSFLCVTLLPWPDFNAYVFEDKFYFRFPSMFYHFKEHSSKKITIFKADIFAEVLNFLTNTFCSNTILFIAQQIFKF